jgi:nucleotide-binding universal stress UspA family protein
MTIASILLHDPDGLADPAHGPADWALGLAAATGASLTAIAFDGDGTAPPDALLAAAAEHGVDVHPVTERSFAYGLPEVLGDHARLHDLVVTGSEPGGLLSVRALAEHLVLDSGRPAVVVPRAWCGPFRCDRVVVAWDNTRAAARALGDALPLLRSARAVTLVMAGGEKAIDTSLGELDLVAALARRGVSGAAVQRIDQAGGSIGETLAAWARAQDADLLVAGAFGHSRLRQLVLGGVTRSLLDAPPLPVLLSH